MASTKVTEKNLILVVSGDAKKAEKEMAKVRDAINASFKDPQSTLEKFGSMARESWDKYESGAVRALRATNHMVEAFVEGKDKGEALVEALKQMPGIFGAIATGADTAADAIVYFLGGEQRAQEKKLLADIKSDGVSWEERKKRAKAQAEAAIAAAHEDADRSAAGVERRAKHALAVEVALQKELEGIAKAQQASVLQSEKDSDAELDRREEASSKKSRERRAREAAAELQSLGNHIRRVAEIMDAERLGILEADQRLQDARAALAEAGSRRAQDEIKTSIERAKDDAKEFLEKFEAEVERLEELRTQDPWEALAKGSKRFGADLQVLQSSFEGLGQVAGQAFQAILTGNESVSAAGLLDAFLESIGMEFQMLAIKEAGLALASAFVPGMQAAAAGHAAAAAIFQGGAIAAGLGARAIDSGGGGVPGGAGGGANDAGRASSSGSGGNTVVENHYNLGWGFFNDQKQFMREMDRMRREAESDGTVPPAGARGPGGRRR